MRFRTKTKILLEVFKHNLWTYKVNQQINKLSTKLIKYDHIDKVVYDK